MATSDVAAQFITLFRGRGDCYGSWEGGCVKQPLTHAHFEAHLHDGPFIGVYPAVGVVGAARCVWGCTDIDHTDDPTHAFKIRSAFDAVSIPAWVERTAHGWHVWVFATELVPCADMRRMFLAAHQVADVQPKEVNPKQTELFRGQVGNYVRLPYPGWLNNDPETGALESFDRGRYIVDNEGAMMSLESFVEQAVDTRVSGARIKELADYYIPPAIPTIGYAEPTSDMREAASMLTPLGRVIWRDGPIEGRDRSTTMAHLVFECAKAGIATSDALMLLKDADLRWGKRYQERGAAGEAELLKLVERAYGSAPTPST